MSCTPSITAVLQNTDTFNSWVSNLALQLQTFASKQDPTVDDINTLAFTIAPDIKAHQDCIMSLGTNAATVSTDLANLNTKLQSLIDAVAQREKDVAITHDRAAIARNPEMTRGYYDGWFPISRPLKHYTIPVLISISLFLFALSFFYFLSLFGIDIQLATEIPLIRNGSIATYGAKSLYTSKPFIIMATISVILLILTIYGFTRKV